jgi:hypothetical protein
MKKEWIEPEIETLELENTESLTDKFVPGPALLSIQYGPQS